MAGDDARNARKKKRARRNNQPSPQHAADRQPSTISMHGVRSSHRQDKPGLQADDDPNMERSRATLHGNRSTKESPNTAAYSAEAEARPKEKAKNA
jgi:hypothetical protein